MYLWLVCPMAQTHPSWNSRTAPMLFLGYKCHLCMQLRGYTTSNRHDPHFVILPILQGVLHLRNLCGASALQIPLTFFMASLQVRPQTYLTVYRGLYGPQTL